MTNPEDDLANKSRKHYETLIQELESLIHIISFEERTHLTLIMGYADYLLSGQLGDLTDEQQQAIEGMRLSAKRLQDIVNFSTDELMILNLLHGRTKPKLARINIQEWLEKSTKSFSTALEAKNQQLIIEVSGSQYAKSDYYCFSKMLGYLVDNAHRYTGEDGQIVITSKTRSDDILISIKDDGIGIAREEQKHVFENGFRGSHELVRQSGGLGKGLYNAQRLAQILGCELGVKSEVDKGSTFWFTLPLAEAGEEE